MRIGVVLGSVREGRKGAEVARWVLESAAGREAQYELIDLAVHELPHLAEPVPPMAGQYRNRTTLAWATLISEFDGFVIVTPEYNHGIPGVLKNALDHLYAEWAGKPVGLVGYGLLGGARALDQLRVLTGVLGMSVARVQVELELAGAFDESGIRGEGAHTQAIAALLAAVEMHGATGPRNQTMTAKQAVTQGVGA